MTLTLASTSPQRRAILEQLRIPFEAVAPTYVEHDPPEGDPAALVRVHALGKARSAHTEGQVTLGVDTTVHLDGRLYGKPEGADDDMAALRDSYQHLCKLRDEVIAAGILPPVDQWKSVNPNL